MAVHPVNPKTLDSFLKNINTTKTMKTAAKLRIPASRSKENLRGSYSIPREQLKRFYELYHQAVFEGGVIEYLTEKQNPGKDLYWLISIFAIKIQ